MGMIILIHLNTYSALFIVPGTVLRTGDKATSDKSLTYDNLTFKYQQSNNPFLILWLKKKKKKP